MSQSATPARWLALGMTALCLVQAARAASADEGLLVGRVTRVADGDTLRLQQGPQAVAVRLAAIDAPEMAQPHGAEARDALRACAFGRLVTVRVRTTDRHGRAVGIVESAGRDCGLAQLQAGLAWHAKAYAHEQGHSEREHYSAAERAARQRRLGLWADANPVTPWHFRRTHPD
jgi:endonuclease YncB( thermonuclease family)